MYAIYTTSAVEEYIEGVSRSFSLNWISKLIFPLLCSVLETDCE